MTKGPAVSHGQALTLALPVQVNRLANLDADALVGHNISAFDLDILLHRLEKHKVRGRWRPEYICNDCSSRPAHTRPPAAQGVGLLLAAITPAMVACLCKQCSGVPAQCYADGEPSALAAWLSQAGWSAHPAVRRLVAWGAAKQEDMVKYHPAASRCTSGAGWGG